MNSATTQRADEIQHDRRRHVRVPARGVASHLQTMDASMPGLAVENLSQSGMFVRCGAALAVGTRVMVQLVRPGLKRAIPVVGCVVSVVAPAEAQKRGIVAGMGLRLDPTERDAAQRLRELVDDLAMTRPAAPPAAPVVAAPPPVAEAPQAPVAANTSGQDADLRGRLVQQLEEEVVALRGELLRRNRTIAEMAARLAAFEAAEERQAIVPPRESRRSAVRPRVLRRVDPRAE